MSVWIAAQTLQAAILGGRVKPGHDEIYVVEPRGDDKVDLADALFAQTGTRKLGMAGLDPWCRANTDTQGSSWPGLTLVLRKHMHTKLVMAGLDPWCRANTNAQGSSWPGLTLVLRKHKHKKLVMAGLDPASQGC